MVAEHFKNNDALAVYHWFRDKGRMAPEGPPPEHPNSTLRVQMGR